MGYGSPRFSGSMGLLRLASARAAARSVTAIQVPRTAGTIAIGPRRTGDAGDRPGSAACCWPPACRRGRGRPGRGRSGLVGAGRAVRRRRRPPAAGPAGRGAGRRPRPLPARPVVDARLQPARLRGRHAAARRRSWPPASALVPPPSRAAAGGWPPSRPPWCWSRRCGARGRSAACPSGRHRPRPGGRARWRRRPGSAGGCCSSPWSAWPAPPGGWPRRRWPRAAGSGAVRRRWRAAAWRRRPWSAAARPALGAGGARRAVAPGGRRRAGRGGGGAGRWAAGAAGRRPRPGAGLRAPPATPRPACGAGVDLVLWPEDVVDVEGELAGSAGGAGPWPRWPTRSTPRSSPAWSRTSDGDRFRNAAVPWGPDGTVSSTATTRSTGCRSASTCRPAASSTGSPTCRPCPVTPSSAGARASSTPRPDGSAWSSRYEVFFPDRARAAVRAGGRVVLVPTNASSYRDAQMPAQEVAVARLRALETGRWVVQAAPTGYSAVIDHRGRVLARSRPRRRPRCCATGVDLRDRADAVRRPRLGPRRAPGGGRPRRPVDLQRENLSVGIATFADGVEQA